MNVSSIPSASTSVQPGQVQNAVQVKVLHKSMDDQAQIAQNLLQALPQNQNSINSSYLGRNIDVRF